jgi:hypothetical protein
MIIGVFRWNIASRGIDFHHRGTTSLMLMELLAPSSKRFGVRIKVFGL